MRNEFINFYRIKTMSILKLKSLWAPLCCALLLSASASAQDEAVMAMERMRENLRAVTLQLRTAQNELAVAKVQNESLNDDNKRLQARLEQLAKQSAEYKATAEANAESLGNQLSDRNGQVERLAASLRKWQTAYDKAAEIARAKEAERAALAMQLLVAERDLGNLRTHNMELYQLGTQILNRYEDFGLGRAIKAREPFTGLARAKLQTLAQDYRDALAENRLTLSGENTAQERSE